MNTQFDFTNWYNFRKGADNMSPGDAFGPSGFGSSGCGPRMGMGMPGHGAGFGSWGPPQFDGGNGDPKGPFEFGPGRSAFGGRGPWGAPCRGHHLNHPPPPMPPHHPGGHPPHPHPGPPRPPKEPVFAHPPMAPQSLFTIPLNVHLCDDKLKFVATLPSAGGRAKVSFNSHSRYVGVYWTETVEGPKTPENSEKLYEDNTAVEMCAVRWVYISSKYDVDFHNIDCVRDKSVLTMSMPVKSEANNTDVEVVCEEDYGTPAGSGWSEVEVGTTE